MTSRPMLAVAHRAGNDLDAVCDALAAGVDLVEADLHLRRGAVEIRHHKTLGPTLLWDRWELLRRRDLVVPDLAGLLAAAEAGGGADRLMLDLKGLHPRLGPVVRAHLRARPAAPAVTICTRHWWMLAAFATDPYVRPVLSAGNRRELTRLRVRVRRRPGGFGVSVHRRLLTPVIVDELHRSVAHVLTWPVDRPGELADARRLGVGGVISKSLPLLRDLLAARDR